MSLITFKDIFQTVGASLAFVTSYIYLRRYFIRQPLRFSPTEHLEIIASWMGGDKVKLQHIHLRCLLVNDSLRTITVEKIAIVLLGPDGFRETYLSDIFVQRGKENGEVEPANRDFPIGLKADVHENVYLQLKRASNSDELPQGCYSIEVLAWINGKNEPVQLCVEENIDINPRGAIIQAGVREENVGIPINLNRNYLS
jgi:hypothetical protein